MNLSHALRASKTDSIAFTGAGGKTTAMFRLARELAPAVITASTRLAEEQTAMADRHLAVRTLSELKTRTTLPNTDILLVTGPVDSGKTSPLNPELLLWLRAKTRGDRLPLLIEADGARQKPLKAPASHEPPIPPFVDLVCVLAGLTGLGEPLTAEAVHRPEIFSELSGLDLGQTITIEALCTYLLHPSGGLKNIPPHARKVVLLNQADSLERQAAGRQISQRLLSAFDAVVSASLKDNTVHAGHEPAAGILLAAGGSTRFGRPKQLLEWRGEPFVRAVTKTALAAGLSPVIVVTGSDAKQVEGAVDDLGVELVRNKDWRSGQSSSIRAGVRALPARTGSAIFLLSDQPQVPAAVLNALSETHARELHPIVAPLVLMERRANPVLFDRVTFPDLLRLDGDVGGRAIFDKHHVEYLPWHDDSLLFDVDRPEDYPRMQELE